MNEIDPVDLRSFSENNKNEMRRMLDDSMMYDYHPIQKNSRLFKFILYTTKVEIKSNSLMKMIYSTSLFEFALWIVGLLLFIASPRNMYLIWVLIIHPVKAIFGLRVLDSMPKTYEIIENLARNPNFEEEKILELISTQIRETFIERWSQNRMKLLWYLISTILALIIDIIIFIVQVVVFGNKNLILMQTSLLFIILVYISKFNSFKKKIIIHIRLFIFLVSDIVYFLWFITLNYSFPDYMIDPIKKAIFGSITELKALVFSVFRKNRDESAIN